MGPLESLAGVLSRRFWGSVLHAIEVAEAIDFIRVLLDSGVCQLAVKRVK